jgi:hypothetical protein
VTRPVENQQTVEALAVTIGLGFSCYDESLTREARAALRGLVAQADRVVELEAALRDLLEAIGDPEDVDQDCRFCTGHYFRHSDDCAWANAGRVLPLGGTA